MLAEQLQKIGHNVDLFRAPYINIKNIKNPSFMVLSTFQALATKKRYDIVHAFNVPSGFPMRYIKSTGKIISIHGVYSEQVGTIHSQSALKFASVLESKVLKWADILTTDSKYTIAKYRKHGYDFEYMPTPIDPLMFQKLNNVEKQPKQVVYIGRDSYEKGIDILRNAESDIHGTIRYCTNLKWRDAMSTLAESSILVLPSRIESSPTIIKEAFYLSVPVVAMSVGGVPELVQDGKTGFLVKPGDTNHMVEIINGILKGDVPTDKIVKAAYEYVTHNMTWDVVISQYEDMYKRLLSGSGADQS